MKTRITLPLGIVFLSFFLIISRSISGPLAKPEAGNLTTNGPKGFYVVMSLAASKKLSYFLDKTCLDGVVYYLPWREVEREPGSYRWELLDPIIDEVNAKGKQIGLAVLAGFSVHLGYTRKAQRR